MIREIVLDTETTGLDPSDGHRIIEIAAIELIDHVKTKKQFHCYIYPERIIPETSIKIHNITNEMVREKPRFSEIISRFLDFIKDDILVIHNAEFDLKFLNFELSLNKLNKINNKVIDTLTLAKSKYPGSSVSLDSLCKKFDISIQERIEKGHGALLDCILLSEVYLEILGGKQPNLDLNRDNTNSYSNYQSKEDSSFKRNKILNNRLDQKAMLNHKNFLHEIGCMNSWKGYYKKIGLKKGSNI